MNLEQRLLRLRIYLFIILESSIEELFRMM